jgi:DNA-binding MarR family transcriptional regulator
MGSQPLVGALLRRPSQIIRRRIHAELVEAGFSDLHPAHLNVLQHPGPRGMRPSQLAQAANMTKQAMNHLLGQLVDLGYIKRHQLSDDPRGKVVSLTERGEAAVRIIRRTVLRVEREWMKTLGEKHFAELRRLLVALNEHLDDSAGVKIRLNVGQ